MLSGPLNTESAVEVRYKLDSTDHPFVVRIGFHVFDISEGELFDLSAKLLAAQQDWKLVSEEDHSNIDDEFEALMDDNSEPDDY